MGIRGELFSTKVALPNRTYFFNVKENRMGDLYLNIVESKNRETGGFERQSVVLFADDLKEFLAGFDESLRVLEKSVREKRKVDKPRSGPKQDSPRRTRDDFKPEGPRKPREGSRPEGPRRIREGENSEYPRRAGKTVIRKKPGEAKPPRKPGTRVVKRKD